MRAWHYLSLLLIASIPAAHADYNSASAAYNRGDRNASFMEFSRLAANGEVKAQFMLATQYQKGEGVLQDFVQAHKWFNLAAFAGHPLAGEYRDRIAATMSRSQVAQAQQLARQWRPATQAQNLGTGSAQSASAAATAAQPPGNTTAQLQRLLNANGYDAGPADGRSGRKTRNAIRRYQADSGLYQDGEATASLLEFMQAQFPTVNKMNSNTAAGASEPTAATPAPPPPQAASKTDAQLQQLVTELQQLTLDGERSRAANSRFIGQLRDLVNRYSGNWPWSQVLLDEAFSDTNYQRNTAWQITSGDFFLTRGEGLQSRVTQPVAEQKPNKNKGRDLAINLLGSILNPQQGNTGINFGNTTKPEQAAIHIPLRISNSFALRLTLKSQAASGSIDFNLYQGRSQQTGYRLSYTPGRPGQLQLLRLTRQGSHLVATDNRAVNITDGAPHTLLWSRDGKGTMRVTIDTQERLRGTDSAYRGKFDGFGFANHGGDYTLSALRLYGTR